MTAIRESANDLVGPLRVENSIRRPREADIQANLGDLPTSDVGSAPKSDVRFREAVVAWTTAM
jgi:hypothetical protein